MGWSLKKWIFGNGRTKTTNYYKFLAFLALNPEDVYFLEKYDELSELVAFGQKLVYFTDQNGPWRGHVKINFEYFQIQK